MSLFEKSAKSPQAGVRSYQLHTDGGIVAKPGQAEGQASIGAVLKDPGGHLMDVISRRIGWATDHHVAEYRALIEGLKLARGHRIAHIRVSLDSALVVNTVCGDWKLRPQHLIPLCMEARALAKEFASIEISHVPREQNPEADALASRALGR